MCFAEYLAVHPNEESVHLDISEFGYGQVAEAKDTVADLHPAESASPQYGQDGFDGAHQEQATNQQYEQDEAKGLQIAESAYPQHGYGGGAQRTGGYGTGGGGSSSYGDGKNENTYGGHETPGNQYGESHNQGNFPSYFFFNA